MPKPELEFFPVDDLPWVPVEGAPPGHYQKILSEDPENRFVTRLLKVDPGGASTETLSTISGRRCTSWREVSGMEADIFKKGMYACRPPGMKHGPYRTEEGCITLEFRYVR